MSITEVSILAGEILLALDRSGGRLRLEEILPQSRCSHPVTLMALGWLYKEGHVVIHPAIGGWFIQTPTSA